MISVIIIVIDQVTKLYFNQHLQLGQSIELLPVLNWTLAYNYGAAFSFLHDAGGWQRWFFAILAVAVCVVIVNWLRKLSKTRVAMAAALALVLGGAIGNLIDRLMYGKVIDFIDVYFDIPFVMDNYHFATFNVADIAITCGAMVLVFLSLFTNDLES